MTASAREEAQESSKAVKQWRFAACLLVRVDSQVAAVGSGLEFLAT